MTQMIRKSLIALVAAVLMAATPALIVAAQPPAAPAEPAATTEAAPDATATPAGAVELDPILAGTDLVRGKKMFSQAGGNCISCHGWDGDGMGKNPRSEGAAALLRESGLDAAGFIEIISCGIPGTPMPYHDSQAYKGDGCYGMKAADFEAGQMPHKGKTIRHEDLLNLVAYIQTSIQGKPKATYEDCVAWYEASADKACAGMKK